MSKYDSKAEAKAASHPLIKAFSYSKCDDTINHNLKDSEGESFSFKLDFKSADSRLPLLEYKPLSGNGGLNRLTSQQSARKAAARWQGGSGYYKYLETGWNHSLYKQTLVQHSYPPLHYVVVFDKIPKPDDIRAYEKRNLFWITLDNLANFLLTLDCAKNNVAGVYFNQPISNDEYYQYDLKKYLTRE